MLSYVLLIAALAGAAIAQSSDISSTAALFSTSALNTASQTALVSAQTTIPGWAGVPSGIVGSIVAANACETTVVLICTDAMYCPRVKDLPVSFDTLI